jgi:hypothetical protein
MNLQILLQSAVDRLLNSVEENSSLYAAGKADELLKSGDLRPSRIIVGDCPDLLNVDGTCKSDAVAAELVYRWLSRLTPVEASDNRLWTWLAHGPLSQYTFQRWKLGLERAKGDPSEAIVSRWFFKGRSVETFVRNAISRLWWFGHLSHDADRASPFELTAVLVEPQQMQQDFLERSFGRSRRIVRVVLETALKFRDQIAAAGNKGDVIKAWALALNARGGAFVLDALPDERLRAMCERCLLDQIQDH